MKKLNYEDVRSTILKDKTVDIYYKELRDLQSDVEFFNLLMKREKKSAFDFSVMISKGGATRSFDALFNRYGRNTRYIENAFVEFEALKILINQANASDEERVMNDDAIAELIYYFEQYDDFNVEKYVSDFIGCSRSACGTMANIQNIRKNYF